MLEAGLQEGGVEHEEALAQLAEQFGIVTALAVGLLGAEDADAHGLGGVHQVAEAEVQQSGIHLVDRPFHPLQQRQRQPPARDIGGLQRQSRQLSPVFGDENIVPRWQMRQRPQGIRTRAAITLQRVGEEGTAGTGIAMGAHCQRFDIVYMQTLHGAKIMKKLKIKN